MTDTASKSSIKSLLLDFGSTTTAHGFNRVASQRPIFTRILWVLCISAATVWFCVHLSSLVNRYLSLPVNTKVKLNSIEENFPLITICNHKPLVMSKMATKTAGRPNPTDGLWLPNAETQNFGEFINKLVPIKSDAMTDLVAEMPSIEEGFKYYYGPADDVDEYIVRDSWGYQRLEKFLQDNFMFIIECRFGSQICQPDDFDVIHHPRFLKCFSFNVTRFIENQNLTTSLGSKKNIISGSKLHLTLFAEAMTHPIGVPILLQKFGASSYLRGDYFHNEGSGGIQILFSKGNVFPYDDHFLPISTGTHTKFKLQLYETVKLSTKENPCKKGSEERKTVTYRVFGMNSTTHRYHKEDCVNKKIVEKIYNTLGCLPFDRPIPENIADKTNSSCFKIPKIFNKTKVEQGRLHKNITPERKEFLEAKNFYYTVYKRYYRIQEIFQEKIALWKTCEDFCTDQSFRIQSHQSKWPGKYPKVINNLMSRIKYTNPKFKDYNSLEKNYRPLFDVSETINDSLLAEENLARISIEMLTNPSYQVTEEEAYPIINLFSDLGGILGLYIGISVLTLVEIIELLVLVIIKAVIFATSRRSVQVSDTDIQELR